LGDQLVAELRAKAPLLVSLPEAARLTGITVRTLRRYVARGLLRTVRPAGGHPRVPRAELERLVLDGLEH
jgi:excisionase family DNA binding protein